MKLSTNPAYSAASTCSVSGSTSIECTFSPAILFTAFDGLALTVTSN